MSEETISEKLISYFGFRKYYDSVGDLPDYNKYTCIIRVHELHYLLWSEEMKHFTLRLKHEHPKGQPGGAGIQFHTDVMIPKTIYTVQDAYELVNGMVDTDKLHLYNC